MEQAAYYSHTYPRQKRIQIMLKCWQDNQARLINQKLLKDNKKTVIKKAAKVWKFVKDNF
jgi:hypothetical protein